MHGNNLKYYFVKLVKPLLIALPLNLLAGLIYCLIAKKMSIVLYSDVLAFIGVGYIIIGGVGLAGGMSTEKYYTLTVSKNIYQKNIDDYSRSNFNMTFFIIGISTILISYVVATFR